ncbi:hypothetical protein C5L14_23270 [Labrys okinawensis]|uniref:Phage tail lysozyme domain-containing protein n=1 Tax=Labrys okinawensis TaxID=346911 RepID=A0A2S9Q7U3_9HYPH|nr:hypothetical protein [Labrys okinawensis]PRH85364.1 hypothetical protein C5L14_23270 [Labrys okinawensis]
MAEELVLPASVTDRFSKPLQDLQKKLKDFRPSDGMRAVERNFRTLRDQVNQATRAIKDAGNGLAGGMGLPGLSIGALSAAGAIAALTANTRQFATQTVAMRNFARDTGIATAKLKELQAVSAGLGIDSDAMKQAVTFSAQNADALRRHQGTFQELSALGPGGRSIANDLAGTKSNDEVLEKSLRYLQNQKDAQQRRTLARMLFGDESMGALGNESPADLATRRSAARASISQQSKDDEEKAKAFLDSTERVSAALDKIKLSVGGALAPNLTAVADAMAAFANANSGQVKAFFDDVGKTLSSHNWSEDAAAIALVFGKTRAFIEYMTSLSPKLDQNMAGSRDAAKPGEIFQQKTGTWLDQLPKNWFSLGLKKGSFADWLLNGSEPGQPAHPHTATPTPGTDPNANRGMRETFMGADPIAYRPGARAAFTGMARAQDTVATIAAGVTKGMQDFAQTLQAGDGGAPSAGGGGGGGFMKASYQPGGGARGALNGMRAVREAVGVTTPSYNPGSEPAGKRIGGTRSWRNFNPGNIEYGKFAASHGAIGTDGRFAIFPDYATGRKAQESLLFDSKRYRDLTLSGAIHRWAPASENNVPAYLKAMGADPNTRMRDFTPAQRQQLLNAMQRHEGWRAGRIIGADPTPTASATPRKSAANTRAKADAAAAGRDGLHGRVSIDVRSKDHPVDAKTDGSPLFQELSIKRGNLMSI